MMMHNPSPIPRVPVPAPRTAYIAGFRPHLCGERRGHYCTAAAKPTAGFIPDVGREQMTGLPDQGRRLFHQAEDVLRELGWQVLNPAILPDGLPDDRYMPICLAMLSAADTVMLLPGWETSRGARLEAQYAVYQHIPCVVVESLIPFRAAPLSSMVWY